MPTTTSTMTVATHLNLSAIKIPGKDTSPEKHLTIDRMLKSHASEPEDPLLVAYPATGVADFEEHTARALDRFTDAAVARYISLGLEAADPAREEAPVVAILAPSSFELVVTIFALNRLGWSTLFLSTRLSVPAHARLLGLANCNTIITTEAFMPAIKTIEEERPCKTMPMIEPQHYRNIDATKFHREIDPVKECQKIAWIIHSSGSTGFPKPIFLSNGACLANFRKNFGLRAFCTSPLFHSHGLMELFRAIYAKKPMYLGNYAFPITRQNVIDALKAAKPEIFPAVPYVLKLLAEKSEGIIELAKTRLVLYGGSACPDDLGNRLVARGVNLVANYGATETGQIMTSFRPEGDNEWSYMRLHYPIANHVLMDEISPEVFECVALDGLPSKGPSNSMDPPNSFRTRDLFSRHPDPKKSNFWKYLSRLDDRITLVNGEKVLPIPIEGRIRQDELVKEAAVFGVGRTVPGVLVFKRENSASLSDETYLQAIWPAIEAANAVAETFSQIPRDLVILKSADTVYPRTDKGTFIREMLYKQFETDIDAVYSRFEKGQTGTLQLDVPELETFLMSKFSTDLGVHLESVESDIFAEGVDSLQTMRMWRIIKSELDLGDGGAGDLSPNIVFEKGNVKALAKYLYCLRTGEVEEENNEVDLMREMIEKYSVFETHSKDGFPPKPEKDVVVLTGATGSIGTRLLADLVRRDNVSKVWALVRASDATTAHNRVLESLSSHQCELSEDKTSKIFVLPSDFSKADLGLSEEDLEGLLSSTHVIHCAWAVNFNLGVRSFKSQHIAGTRNLINICLRSRFSSPAKFFFCSSVSTASGTPKPARIAESAIGDLSHAQKTGYGRSKLVAEHIVRNAMRSTGMDARVLRIGQVSGDGVTGYWNETEAVALMIRTAVTVGALPSLDESPSWLPVDACSNTILDLVFTGGANSSSSKEQLSQNPDTVYHIVNPRSFHWGKELLPALRRTKLPAFEVVQPQEWLKRLKESDQDPVKNPSIKLIDFWEAKYGCSSGGGDPSSRNGGDNGDAAEKKEEVVVVEEEATNNKGLIFETDLTVAASPTLKNAPHVVDEGYIERYVDSWLKKWRP